MANKVLREKPNCVVCLSSKLRFLKQKRNNNKKFSGPIKSKIVFTSYKNMHIYCKNWKKTQILHVSKKFSPDFKNKIKGKLKCATCLTERTFIHEIEDKYDLESELEIYLQFFTDWYYKRTWRLIV